MTDLSREYGDGLYALCAEEGIAKEVLEQLQALKACFDEQPDFCRLLSNMSLSKQEPWALWIAPCAVRCIPMCSIS